jgi:hypothetical protein
MICNNPEKYEPAGVFLDGTKFTGLPFIPV